MKILKTTTLALLLTIAIFLIFGEPDEMSPTWYADFLSSKALGFAILYVCRLIYNPARRRAAIKNRHGNPATRPHLDFCNGDLK